MRNLYDIAFSPVDPTQLFIPINGTDDARSDDEAADDPLMQGLEDSDDLLYVTDIDDAITVTDPETGEPRLEPIIDDFGFPSCLYNEAKRGNLEPYDNPNPDVIAAFGPCPVETVPRPVSSFGLHVSADGLAFQTSDAWGPDYKHDLFVAEFGNFFGTEVVGHEVIRVQLDETGKQVVRQSEFVSGVVPLDIAFGPDGSMFIADVGGTIYRVAKVADVPDETEVMMNNFQFVPAAIVVAQGATVRWINNDTLGFPHNATAQQSLTLGGLGEGSAFGTPTISAGESTEVVMQTPGVYRYICTVHPQQMQGSITVVPAGS
jgi:plastocyanin